MDSSKGVGESVVVVVGGGGGGGGGGVTSIYRLCATDKIKFLQLSSQSSKEYHVCILWL